MNLNRSQRRKRSEERSMFIVTSQVVPDSRIVLMVHALRSHSDRSSFSPYVHFYSILSVPFPGFSSILHLASFPEIQRNVSLSLMVGFVPAQNLQDSSNVPASFAVPFGDGVQVRIGEL